MSEFDVDLFVIGAGSGGVRAGRIAAQHGARVIVAEEDRVGGTCVIRGCVPKKLLVYASQFSEAFEDAAGYGWTVGETRFDWPTLIAAKDKEIQRLSDAYVRNLERAGATLVRQRAEFEDAQTVRLADDSRVRAKTILIATGARAYRDPALPGAELAITSNEAFHLADLPKRIVIVGAGYIAVEFAGIFNGLGSEVTLVHRGSSILRGFDGEVARMLTDEMTAKGVRFVLGETPERIERRDNGLVLVTDKGSICAADQVMLATGRRPNTDTLGLDKAGVAVDGAGAVIVDKFSQSNVPSIYAVGDVTNRINLTPVAIREGHAFADTVFGGQEVAVDHTDVPTAVFSQPEIGTVGLTEEKAIELYDSVDVYRARFRPMTHTLSGREERTLMKLLVDAATDRVLGAHILGPDAGEMAQLLGIAIKMRATKRDFDATMAVHPTAAEEIVTMREPNERHRK